MMLNDSSHIASYPRNEASQYCNDTSPLPSGCSFAPETIMPAQDPLFASQGIFDHGVASQPSSNSNIAWCTPRGSGGVTMPVISSQPHDLADWFSLMQFRMCMSQITIWMNICIILSGLQPLSRNLIH